MKSFSLCAVLLGACLSTFAGADGAQAEEIKFTTLKFFETKGEFDWDKVVYGEKFEQTKLHELQLLIEFENPDGKPFDLEVRSTLDGKPHVTEPFKELKGSGGFNSGLGGDSGAPGKVKPGLYQAEVVYQGKVVLTAKCVVTGGPAAEISTAPSDEPQVPVRDAGKTETITDLGLTMTFAKDWDTAGGKTSMAGVSPDGKIRIQSYISQAATVQETLANMQREFDSWCEGLQLTDPNTPREANGLKIMSTGGQAKLKNGGQDIDVAVDVIELEGKVVIVAIYGFPEGMDQYFADIVMSQESFRRAGDKEAAPK